MCQHNTGDRYGWASWVDTCELPMGHWSRCDPNTPCDQGEGDCDADDDCVSGLSCRHDMGHVYGFGSTVDVCADVSDLSCPEDYFSPADVAAAQEPRFRLPIDTASATDPLGPGATNWFKDHGAGGLPVPFKAGHLTYPNHFGTDFMLAEPWFVSEVGEVPAVAAADGWVLKVEDGNPDKCGVGWDWSQWDHFILCDGDDPHDYASNYVDVCHVDGSRTKYHHMMNGEMQVEPGDEAECGDPLGLVASAGRSASPHLHFQVEQDGTTVDPFHFDASQSMWVDQQNTFVQLPAETCE